MNESARVAVTGTNPATLDAASRELGKDAVIVASDAGDLAAQRTLAKAVGQAFGQLDILVVNAGIVDMRPLEKWDEKAFDRSFGINFKGPFFLIQALLPVFANPASIVLTTSINAHIGMPNTSIYGASKAAGADVFGRADRTRHSCERGLPRPDRDTALRQARSGEGRSRCRGGIAQEPDSGAEVRSPAEVAQAIVFLASDEAAFTVGSELVIDGGLSNL